MDRFKDLAIVLKTIPFQERDKVLVVFTENHGKRTALAKGAIHSKRFGGALDFLSCSQVEIVQKETSEMGRIDSASIYREFRGISQDFEKLTIASFVAEFYLKLVEPQVASREIFVLLANVLYALEGSADVVMPPIVVLNAFLCKILKQLGYPPSLLRCVACSKGAHEVAGNDEPSLSRYFWSSNQGGMICFECSDGKYKKQIPEQILFYFHKLTMTPFKELKEENGHEAGKFLFSLLSDFLEHHVPGMDRTSIKSWEMLSQVAS